MEAIKAIERLNWMKQERKNLGLWIDELDVNSKPVNGIHWRKLKKVIEVFEEEMIEEIRSFERAVREKLEDIEIDV